jgi:uncharacterized membrane protein
MEIFFVVLSLMIAWFIGAFYGWSAHERFIQRTMAKALVGFEEEFIANRIKIKIEKHNDTLFVYEHDTNTFMAQGKTKEELEKQLQEKFPGKMFAATTDDIKIMIGGHNESI